MVLSGLKRKERAHDAEELGEELEVKEWPACEFHQNTEAHVKFANKTPTTTKKNLHLMLCNL